MCVCTNTGEVKWSESCSVVSDSSWPHGLYSPRNSPGQNTGAGSLSLLQGIFPTQGSNPGHQNHRQILYSWATRENILLYFSKQTGEIIMISLFYRWGDWGPNKYVFWSYKASKRYSWNLTPVFWIQSVYYKWLWNVCASLWDVESWNESHV